MYEFTYKDDAWYAGVTGVSRNFLRHRRARLLWEASSSSIPGDKGVTWLRDVAELLTALAALLQAVASVVLAAKGSDPRSCMRSRGRRADRRRG